MAFELERLDQSGITVLTPFDEVYPRRMVERLGPRSPPLLYAAGNLDLLGQPGLGVVGSRPLSPDGAATILAVASLGARLGRPVVCGGPKGAGQLAMDGAWQAGGSVVAVLADPLVRVLKSPDVRRAVHRGAAVLCTPYGPDVPYSAANAIGRSKLVYAQSLVTLVVAVDAGQGDTWTGAVAAIDDGVGRVAVRRGPGEGPGNRALEDRGAVAVGSIEELKSLVQGTARSNLLDEALSAEDHRAFVAGLDDPDLSTR